MIARLIVVIIQRSAKRPCLRRKKESGNVSCTKHQ